MKDFTLATLQEVMNDLLKKAIDDIDFVRDIMVVALNQIDIGSPGPTKSEYMEFADESITNLKKLLEALLKAETKR